VSELAVVTFNVIPQINYSFKYERLGRIAIVNRRRYCARYGYDFIEEVQVVPDRPICWSKIPALLEALNSYEWVLWADSDALIINFSIRLEEFCDPAFDLIVQSQDHFFTRLGIEPTLGLTRMPINTGVFLIRSTPWSLEFLRRAYEQTQFITTSDIWDGVGEQEAMIHLLNKHPHDRKRIKYVDHLQNHPKLYSPADMFVHFYGNHGRHRIPLPQCEQVLNEGVRLSEEGSPSPSQLARFHWCSIQVKAPDAPIRVRDLEHFLYVPADIAQSTM
jgi:galactosyl transferase GMA12/MNN10 family